MLKTRDQIYNELLVIKCRQGDRQAFNELVGRWQKRLWNYAYRVTGSESAAWDIIQDTWHGIIKGINRLEDAAVFPRWAFRITNNKCSDWLRKKQQQQRLNNKLVEDNRTETVERQNCDDKTELLQEVVKKLRPERRALLTLRYKECFEIEQIAEIIGVPQGTVKSRLHRTLNQLREILERSQNG